MVTIIVTMSWHRANIYISRNGDDWYCVAQEQEDGGHLQCPGGWHNCKIISLLSSMNTLPFFQFADVLELMKSVLLLSASARVS